MIHRTSRQIVSQFVSLAALIPFATCALAAMPVIGEDGSMPSLAPLVQTIRPSVVTVLTGDSALSEDEPRRDNQSASGGIGSGVIVDAKRGLIITTYTNLVKTKTLRVVTYDQRPLDAKILGVDPVTDIALLQTPALDLPQIHYAEADQLRIGDYVLAVGNHFGIGKSVTSGIVSALGRRGSANGAYDELIQTDAPVNPGSSGGALFNLRGELIGITIGIVGPVMGNVGIGLAVPSDVVQAVKEQLLRFGEVRRGRFGVIAQDVTPGVAEALGLDGARGAILVDVAEGTPANTAGLQRGDVVLAVDGRPIRGATQMRNRVGLVALGDHVILTVLRGDRMLKVDVDMNMAQQAASPSSKPEPAQEGIRKHNL